MRLMTPGKSGASGRLTQRPCGFWWVLVERNQEFADDVGKFLHGLKMIDDLGVGSND